MKKNKKKEIVPYGKLENKVAVLWTRVSSKHQAEENCSLETQKSACQAYALSHNIRIKREMGNTFESAKTAGKLFNEMIDYVMRDKEVNVILVYSFDRFSREGVEVMYKMNKLKEAGKYVISATQPSNPDSAEGELIEQMVCILNKFENTMRRSKTYGGTIASLQRGDYCLPAVPLGYKRYRDGKKLVMKITEDGYILKNAWAWRANGMSEIEICDRLNSMGLKVKYKQLNKILKNPFYCGYIVHPEVDNGKIRGNHPALIEEDVFNAANGIGHTGYEKKVINENYPLRGHIRCADCGCLFTAYEAKQRHIHYYKCNTKYCANNQSLKVMHALYSEFLGQYQIAPKYIPLLNKVMKMELIKQNIAQAEELKIIRANITELENKIQKIKTRFALGEIDREVYDTAKDALLQEKLKAEAQLQNNSGYLSNIDKVIAHTSVIASKLSSLWENGDYQQKVNLQNLVFPEGVLWDRSIGDYRTSKVNSVFSLIDYIPTDNGPHNTKSDSGLSPESLQVEKRRLERPTPTSRT